MLPKVAICLSIALVPFINPGLGRTAFLENLENGVDLSVLTQERKGIQYKNGLLWGLTSIRS